nr:alpha/beta hydrolase [Eubacterium sp.]
MGFIILKWIGIVLAVLLAIALMAIVIARIVNYVSMRRNLKKGIDERIYVTLGGQEQYLSIQGADVSNPVIIWLHGGPAGADTFINYPFIKYLAKDYTIVCWTQRGCGRTYYRNKKQDPKNKTATFDRAIADLDELVDYIRERFQKEKVILMGHSYGTMIGSKYALTKPQKVKVYVGIGQLINMDKGERCSYEHALSKAKEKGHDTRKMEKAYEAYCKESNDESRIALRRQVIPYHLPTKQANQIWLGLSSPYMNLQDVRWFLKQCQGIQRYISLNQALFDYISDADVSDYGTKYEVPVAFISGAEDWVTPIPCIEEYREKIEAPGKELVLVEECGHVPQLDDPEEFVMELKRMLVSVL